MRVILLVWTILFLFLELKQFIMKLIKNEREKVQEDIEESLGVISQEPKLLRDASIVLILLYTVYSLLIASYLWDSLSLILIFIFLILNLGYLISFYKKSMLFEDIHIKITITNTIMSAYNIGFLVYALYNFMAR